MKQLKKLISGAEKGPQSFMKEYLGKGIPELKSELGKLISEYNKLRDTYLFVYAAATEKPVYDTTLQQEDFYVIYDMLRGVKEKKRIDMYVETHGGRGETVEEIANLLHNRFEEVFFVVAGEAKSAGTILVLSGDDILMTETGSLGPIDAQIRIGRSPVSAYDYMEWVTKRRGEAEATGKLNPFDATMVAQISPGELIGVEHTLKFAEDLVVDWLVKYKFKNWNITRTAREPVTDDKKRQRAKEIANALLDHRRWRLHGRSIKINDLNRIGLEITKIDDSPELSEVVYRIQTICKLFSSTTTTFKIFATKDVAIIKQAALVSTPKSLIRSGEMPDAVTFEVKCQKCGKSYKIYAKLVPNPKIDEDHKRKGFIPFPIDNKIRCECGVEIEISGIKNQIEMQAGKKIVQ